MSRSTLAAAVVGLLLPVGLAAQDADAPPQILSVSQWICPQDAIGDISDAYEQYTLPVEREMIAEGLMMSAGMFFHAWADEWNVGYYRVAPGMDGLMDAIGEVGRRVNERNPQLADQPGPFARCTAHKDNLYFLGPNSMTPESNGG